MGRRARRIEPEKKALSRRPQHVLVVQAARSLAAREKEVSGRNLVLETNGEVGTETQRRGDPKTVEARDVGSSMERTREMKTKSGVKAGQYGNEIELRGVRSR